MGKLLTVSIAAYNVEKYIGKTLSSFPEEVIDKLEIFVIDDGGTDGTISIANKYANKYPNSFIPVHKSNGGWGSTVNYAIQHASGFYFKILDGDDWFASENLPNYLQFLESVNSDLVYTPYFTVDNESERFIESIGKLENVSNSVLNMHEAAKSLSFVMHNITVRTELLKSNGINLLEHCFYTDVEFFIKCLAYSENVSVFNKEIYCYRIGREGQSVSITGLEKHINEWREVYRSMLNFYSSLPIERKNIVMISMQRDIVGATYVFYFKLGMIDDLKEFDEMIKSNYRELYAWQGKRVALLRLTHFTRPVFNILFNLKRGH